MEKIDLKCDRCGANMELSEDKLTAFCPYCKNKIYFEKEPDFDEIAKKTEMLTSALFSGLHKTQKKMVKSAMKSFAFAFIFFVAIIIIGYVIFTIVHLR